MSQEEAQTEIDAAMAVAEFLEGFPEDDRPIWFKDIVDCGTYDYASWLLELVLAHGKCYPDEVTYIADVMSDCENAEQYQGDLALALALAGRREEALDRVDLNLERFSENVWIQIASGDVYDHIGSPQTAIEYYVAALEMATTAYAWEGAAERLRPLLGKTGRGAEWNELERLYPKPADPPVVPRSAGRGGLSPAPRHPSGPKAGVPSGLRSKTVPVSAAPSIARRKVGRNDPCPCGSGKKYKKCCLGRD